MGITSEDKEPSPVFMLHTHCIPGQWMTARYVEVLILFMILCHYNNKIEYNWIIRL